MSETESETRRAALGFHQWISELLPHGDMPLWMTDESGRFQLVRLRNVTSGPYEIGTARIEKDSYRCYFYGKNHLSGHFTVKSRKTITDPEMPFGHVRFTTAFHRHDAPLSRMHVDADSWHHSTWFLADSRDDFVRQAIGERLDEIKDLTDLVLEHVGYDRWAMVQRQGWLGNGVREETTLGAAIVPPTTTTTDWNASVTTKRF